MPYLPRSLNPVPGEGDPTYRMSMLPFGTYADANGGADHFGFAVPGMLQEPWNALARLMGTPSNPGTFTQGPDYGSNAADMRTLIESTFGGNATRGAAAGEGAATRALTNQKMLRPDLEGTVPLRAYHGTYGNLENGQFLRERAGQNFDNSMSRAGVSFTDDPAIAESYARSASDRVQRGMETPEAFAERGRGMFPFIGEPLRGATILPVDIYGRGAHLDAGVRDIGTDKLADQIANLKSQGYDYATFPSDREARFGDPSGMEISVWSPNTVKSPLTGETLFSDNGLPSLPGAVVAGAEGNAATHALPEADLAALKYNDFQNGDLAPGQAKHYGFPDEDGHAFLSRFNHNGTKYEASGSINDGTANLDLIAPTSAAWHGASNTLGRGALRQWRDSFLQEFPDVNQFSGERISGARAANGAVNKVQRIPALFTDTGLPSLWGPAQQPQDPQSRPPLLDTPPAIVQEQPGLSGLQTFASGGDVADQSGLSGLRSIPDYGFGPMTPTTMAGYPNTFASSREPDPTWGDRLLSAAEFPAKSVVGQFDAAGSGIADAMRDPSLPNLTNAGVQSGLALMSPELTVGSGLGGMGLAALRDANIIPSADARTLKPAQPQSPSLPALAPEADPVLERIKNDPSLLALYQQIKVEQNNATRDYPGRNGDASRAEAAARVQDLQNQFASALSHRDAAKQGIYDQQVQNAIAARDIELGRDRRFSDTEVGKVYDKLGGYAPLVAGFLPGVASRLAYGPAKTLGNSLLRDLEGVTFGVGANNVPLAYNAFATEVDNPEQRAYSAYGYNLPDGHPDKAKAQAMADSLPKLNPIRSGAAEELYDPEKMAERAAMGAFEGWGGNRLGQMAPGGLGGIFRRSSYQLPPERPGTASPSPEGPKPLAPLGASEELLAGNNTVLDRTSDLAGPASGQTLPVLADAADIAPASPVAARKPRGARRNKSDGSKEPSVPEQILPASGVSPATKAAAGDELRTYFEKGPAKKAAGGGVDGMGGDGHVHVGPLNSSVAGRTDHLPITVKAGSYIVPADIVSALGEGNTNAGTKIVEHMFPAQPESLHFASGGSVPILAAGGETVLSPEQVARVGGGDLNHGHAILDAWVKSTRNDTIKTLKSLPGPQK